MSKKRLAVLVLLLSLSLSLTDAAFATHENDGDHTTIGTWIDHEITYADETVFVIDNFPVIVDNPHVTKIILDWDNPGLPKGEIFLDRVVNGTLGMQIPKNMPRTMNLDFGSSLYSSHSPDLIAELESECFYVLEIPLGTDHVSFGSGSVTAGRWEPVIKDNDSCHDVYSDLLSSLKSQENSLVREETSVLLIPGFDDSVPPTGDKTFKIEYSKEAVQSIKTKSDESFGFQGFDIELKQNSDVPLDIMIPKNIPTPASFGNIWRHDDRPIVLADGMEIDYDIVGDPCYSHYRIPTEDKKSIEVIYTVVLAGEWNLYSPIQFDVGDPCYDKVFFERLIEPPLKQFNSGIPIDKIQCKQDLILIQKHEGSPACVKPETKPKLMQRDWIENKDGITVQFSFCGAGGFDSNGNPNKSNSTHIWDGNYCQWRITDHLDLMLDDQPERESMSESESQLHAAKKLLESAYYDNVNLGPLKFNDVIIGFGIENDTLVMDVLYRYSTSSEMDIVKKKIRDITGEGIKVKYIPFKTPPSVIQKTMPYHWNEYLHNNGIEFSPASTSYANNDDGIGDGTMLCSPLVAPNGTEFYVASTVDVKPFVITDTFIDQEKPDFCRKTWKTDVVLEELDRATSLWLAMGQGRIPEE